MRKWLILVTALVLIVGFVIMINQKTIPLPSKTSLNGEIRFIPIGDSYTIGLGISPEGRWSNVLVKNLQAAGIDIKIISNPSVSGYTVQDAIKLELPVIEKEKPDLVTVLIGANDNFRDKDVEIFKKDYLELLDKLEKLLAHKNIVLITIPDYSKSPAGRSYGIGNSISDSINKYNQVIKDEAGKRGLKTVDIFPLSQSMTAVEFYIDDGLHPSAKGYALWEKEIYPVVYDLLRSP